jgi:hypothetical protein
MMVIPERTVESWLAMEIERELPGAIVWCPTQPRQAVSPSSKPGPDPWDILVKAKHIFAFEAKGLEQGGLVPIWMQQFNALRQLPPTLQKLVYYALPALGETDIARANPVAPTGVMPSASHLQRTPPFGLWARSLTLDEVDAALGAKKSQKNPRLNGAALKSVGIEMRQFLTMVQACKETPTGPEVAGMLREGVRATHELESRRLMWVLAP